MTVQRILSCDEQAVYQCMNDALKKAGYECVLVDMATEGYKDTHRLLWKREGAGDGTLVYRSDDPSFKHSENMYFTRSNYLFHNPPFEKVKEKVRVKLCDSNWNYITVDIQLPANGEKFEASVFVDSVARHEVGFIVLVDLLIECSKDKHAAFHAAMVKAKKKYEFKKTKIYRFMRFLNPRRYI